MCGHKLCRIKRKCIAHLRSTMQMKIILTYGHKLCPIKRKCIAHLRSIMQMKIMINNEDTLHFWQPCENFAWNFFWIVIKSQYQHEIRSICGIRFQKHPRLRQNKRIFTYQQYWLAARAFTQGCALAGTYCTNFCTLMFLHSFTTDNLKLHHNVCKAPSRKLEIFVKFHQNFSWNFIKISLHLYQLISKCLSNFRKMCVKLSPAAYQ